MSSTETQGSSDALSKLRIDRSDESRSHGKRSWRIVWAIVLLLLIGVFGFAVALGTGSIGDWVAVPDALRPRTEVRVATVTVESGRSADALVVATGYLESRRQAMIGARAPGRIQEVHVEEGSNVKQGDVLAILEHADLEASLAAVQATLTRARAELAEQAVVVARTQSDFARSEELFAAQIMTEADYDAAKFGHQAAVARVDALKAAIELSQARVREAEQLKENMFIRAPFDGTVISKDAEVGESILPGGMGEASGRGSVVTIADLEHLEVDSDVKEDFIARIKVGRLAEVAVDAVPDHRYQGQVRKIIPMGDRARATIKVKVEILDIDERLFPNMSSTVYFLPEQTTDVPSDHRRVFARRSAIVDSTSGSYVWIIGDEDRVQRLDIVAGDTHDNRTEIKEGLTGGERVVLDPPDELRDGHRVKLAD